MIKDQWAIAKKYYEEDQNQDMNKSLTECFLSLLPSEHSRGYHHILIGDPNHRIDKTFMHFYTNFWHEDEVEIEEK